MKNMLNFAFREQPTLSAATTLPDEILVHILNFLNAKDLCRVEMVAKRYSQIINSTVFLWKQLAPTTISKPDSISWKQFACKYFDHLMIIDGRNTIFENITKKNNFYHKIKGCYSDVEPFMDLLLRPLEMSCNFQRPLEMQAKVSVLNILYY